MALSLILDKKGDLGDKIEFTRYNKIRTDALVEALENEDPCDGYILVANIDTDENTYTEGKYIFNEDEELEFVECEIKITIKETIKNKKKMFSQKEKLELLLEYIQLMKKMPDDDTLYKGCPIGKFMNDIDKWEEIFKAVNDAKGENT